jgi:LytS/YehU family sensor histidine kinase
MNPHFVFNVLSSIQSFMLDNDMDSTLEYLNDFSSLIRKTMENISAETILLSDEIAYLKRYIKLENLRLGNELTSKIWIDRTLRNRELRIPPMIIQPFVENAIKHGLAPSPQNRILYLSFRLTDNTLRITICDNGIGMRSSAQYNRSGAYHQSKGIKNTTERILYYTQSLNSEIHSDYGVKISDRKRNGNIIGVKVEISLPVMD